MGTELLLSLVTHSHIFYEREIQRMFYELNVGEKTYKLTLTTRDLMKLEDRIGMNPMLIFGTDAKDLHLPKITTMIDIIICSFPKYNHGLSDDEICDIIDAWCEEGHTKDEIAMLVVEIYKASGLYKQVDNDSKN